MELSAELVGRALYEAIPGLACNLADDICGCLADAFAREEDPLAREVLAELLENQAIAREDGVPICQDTGTVWVCLEVGPDIAMKGDVLSLASDAVARAYGEAALRKSVVRDAYCDRANTRTNAPAFTEVHFTDEPGVARLHIMLKGGGSDNASQLIMLNPSATDEDIVSAVVARVREKGANACPPIVVGVGIGGTFDKVAGLSKTALMRPVGKPSPNAKAAALEAAILEAVNASGIGPGGVGGATTALAVHVETAPCHIAALPLAINLGCCALRRATIDLVDFAEASEMVSQVTSQNHAQPSRMPGGSDDAWRGGISCCAGGASEEAQDAASDAASAPIRLKLPLDRAEAAQLKAGDRVLLSGPMYCLRDAGHARLLEELHRDGALPYGLGGQAIFYAGPTPEAAGRPFGAVGPTTSSRMDFATPELYDAGIAATIGKGKRSEAVRKACVRNGAVYFGAVGDAAAFLAKCVTSSRTISYDDLGTEALRRIEVADFPAFVAIDANGGERYR